MGLTILVADAQAVHRLGLRTIFEEDSRVSSIHEVVSEEDLHAQLCLYCFDLIVVNQSLVTDISVFPSKKFVILAAQPDMQLLKAAYQYGSRGYLSINTSAEMLRAILRSVENSFLLEPTFGPWVMQYVFGDIEMLNKSKKLTPREKEIISLLQEGLDKPDVAKKLGIAEITLKIHLKNILKKTQVIEHMI